jgi:hypothetical protein
MNAREISRANIAAAVDETLEECLRVLDGARGESLIQDLSIAIQALRGIKLELQGDAPQRPKRLRSALFIRYALDANDQLSMDQSLKDKVVRIEDIYKRL